MNKMTKCNVTGVTDREEATAAAVAQKVDWVVHESEGLIPT